MENNKKPKVLLVGWDAADWQIINPLLKQGKLPGLARLMDKAAWGNLVTLDPPISPMLWTSIATGKRPYKHGIHGFTELAPDGKTVRPVRVTSRKTKAVWNILNDKGLKTNVIGWWPSHPAEELNGVCVSNFYGVMQEGSASDWPLFPNAVYPPEMEEELADLRVHPKELTAEIMRNFFPDADFLDAEHDPVLRSCMRILAHAASIQSAATHVLENTEWDFSAVYFDALDHFSHLGMKFHPPKLAAISDEDFKKYHYIVEAAYRFHDMMLDRLIDLAGPDCHVLLVSDHGFENGENRLVQLPEEPGAPALEHRPYGVFLAHGKDIKPGQVYGASLLDVAPTVLNLFGFPTAKDMDGKEVQSVINQKHTKLVETYDLGEIAPIQHSDSSAIDDELMQQLAELGYIDLPKNEAEKKTLLSENHFYLARSYADGGLFSEAQKHMELLCEAHPENLRFANFYATILLRLGKLEFLESWLKNQREHGFNTYLNGVLFLQKQMPDLALQQFEKIENIANDALLLQMARAWLQSGNLALAEKYALLALQKNAESTAVLNFMGGVNLQKEAFEMALEYYFDSLKLLYYQPQIHEKIGQCFYWLNMFQEAAQAFEVSIHLSPNNISVKEQLIHLYSKEVLNKKRLAELQNEREKFAVVVSGFPRSGTSMMMNMLQRGGLPLLTDEIRVGDKHNPGGYFELDAVKSTTVNQDYLQEAEGKAVKIVMPLLRLVHPVLPLKVIWMTRELSSVTKSQQIMRGEENAPVSLTLMQQLNREQGLMETWLNQYPHVSYIKVSYEETLKNPQIIAAEIARFIGGDLAIDEMKKAVKTVE